MSIIRRLCSPEVIVLKANLFWLTLGACWLVNWLNCGSLNLEARRGTLWVKIQSWVRHLMDHMWNCVINDSLWATKVLLSATLTLSKHRRRMQLSNRRKKLRLWRLMGGPLVHWEDARESCCLREKLAYANSFPKVGCKLFILIFCWWFVVPTQLWLLKILKICLRQQLFWTWLPRLIGQLSRHFSRAKRNYLSKKWHKLEQKMTAILH